MERNFPRLPIAGFKLSDPRVFMSCVLIVYTVVGQTFLSFDHSWLQILLSLCVSCILDMLLNYKKTHQIVWPLSGVITGLGLGLLIEATSPGLLWPYIVAPLLAIASKSFIRIQGKHIFNPSNFGLTALLLLFPSAVTTISAQWSGSLLVVVFIFLIGSFSAFRVSRLDLVLSFLGGFCLMALLEEYIQQSGFALVYGPLLGAGLQLFVLSMITDPKTTPSTRRQRILFGLVIALLDGLLRLAHNQYSQFIALFIVSACFPVYQVIVDAILARRNKPDEEASKVEPTQGLTETAEMAN